jgi:hypothetical protein
MFSHEAEVGIECMLNLGFLPPPLLHRQVLVFSVVVGHQTQSLV